MTLIRPFDGTSTEQGKRHKNAPAPTNGGKRSHGSRTTVRSGCNRAQAVNATPVVYRQLFPHGGQAHCCDGVTARDATREPAVAASE